MLTKIKLHRLLYTHRPHFTAYLCIWLIRPNQYNKLRFNNLRRLRCSLQLNCTYCCTHTALTGQPEFGLQNRFACYEGSRVGRIPRERERVGGRERERESDRERQRGDTREREGGSERGSETEREQESVRARERARERESERERETQTESESERKRESEREKGKHLDDRRKIVIHTLTFMGSQVDFGMLFS